MTEEKMMTIKEVAAASGISVPTLKRMVSEIEGAVKQSAPTASGYYWLIPAASLSNLKKKSVGRPQHDNPSPTAESKRRSRQNKKS